MRAEDWNYFQKHIGYDMVQNPIIEIGSRKTFSDFDVNLKELFKDYKYYGLDLLKGDRVDIIGNIESVGLKSNSVGFMVCIGTLEHIEKFWIAIDEIHRILRKNCFLFLATVFNFYLHAPPDYWRFSPMGLDLLLKKFGSHLIDFDPNLPEHGTTANPVGVYAIARK